MTLISILVGLAAEYFFGPLNRFRNFAWFDAYSNWLEQRCNVYAFWEGRLGLLLTLAVPLLVLAVVGHFLEDRSFVLVFLLATAVFIYCLGPDLNSLLDQYAAALEKGDEAAVHDLEQSLLVGGVKGADEGECAIRSIVIRSHDNIFGVIFWFIMLGLIGPMLYALVLRLRYRYKDIRGGYGDAVRSLHRILQWPSARLQALGFALAGSLIDSLEAWKTVDAAALETSDELLGASGIGAVRYAPETESEDQDTVNPLAGWVQETQALINRTLLVWLTALGFLTLGGWLS